MPKIITIQSDGTRTEQECPDDGTRPELHTLQQAVGGGLIQHVNAFLPEGARMEAFANENGVRMGFRENPEGSKAINWPVGTIDQLRGLPVENIVGPIVILEGFPTHDEIDQEIEAAFESGDAEFCLFCSGVARLVEDALIPFSEEKRILTTVAELNEEQTDTAPRKFRCTECQKEYDR